MLRSQNYSYVFNYLKRAKENGHTKDNPAIKLIRTIVSISSQMIYQPGFPKYTGEGKEARAIFKEFEISLSPGITETTWCNYLVYNVFVDLGYNVAPLLNKEYNTIGYTTIDVMYNQAKSDIKNVTEISWKDSILKANQGIPVMVAALGKGKNSSHVGIVSPMFCNIDKIKMEQMMIGQCGYYCGFGTLADFFSKQYVKEPSFFELKKKE